MVQCITEYLVDGAKQPKQLVILLHGYGSNMQDLITLAPDLYVGLPSCQIISVNAPCPFEKNPTSEMRQWFSLMSREEDFLYQGASEAAIGLQEFIEEQSAKFIIPYSKIALIGFSQGCMLALHAAYRMAPQIAGVIGYSGMLIKPKLFASEIFTKPPALLVHGEEDEVVIPQCMEMASQALRENGVSVDTILRPFLGHGIDPFGIHAGNQFLRKVLV